MDEWKPIETAPEGKDILVCVTYNLGDGEWETVQWVDWRSGLHSWPIYRDRIDIPYPPTRWMHLPSPPQSI